MSGAAGCSRLTGEVIYSHLDVKRVKDLSPLLSDANQSQGGDMKRKSH